MWKPIVAGLMCLGFVTLGVVALGAQESDETDLIVIEGKPEGVAVPPTTGEGVVERQEGAREGTVEVDIGSDVKPAGEGPNENRKIEVLEGGDVIILSDDGKVVRNFKGGALQRMRAATPVSAPGSIGDPGTREALEKLIASLKEEARRLEAEGKKEESAGKRQSIQAVKQLLNPGPRAVQMLSNQLAPRRVAVQNRVVRIEEGSRAAQAMKKLHARLAELRDQASKNQDGDAHARIQQEIADLHKKLVQLSEQQGQLQTAAQQPVAPPVGQPLPWLFGGSANSARGADVFGEGSSPEVAALMRKSQALAQAAHQLQQAGLEDQSRELLQQAEKLRADAEKIRAQAAAQRPAQAISGGGFAGGPPSDLQRSLHELHEQIQQLRKDIGELRELLQQARK